jgi:plasmid maintenance system killer protein
MTAMKEAKAMPPKTVNKLLALEEMNIAGFRFHGLQGNPKRWSVRVTGNYQITFCWSGKNAMDVDFEDYH